MTEATVAETLEMFGKLSSEDQEMVLEIVRKRRAEQWRKEVARDARKAVRDFRAGKLKAVPLDEMIKRLHQMADEEA